MSNGTTDPLPAPRYNIMLTSGIVTAAAFGIGLICLTVYAASPTRPPVTAGLTAICAVAATIGAFLIVQAVMFRKVAKIRKNVDEHGRNVFVDHHALHRDAIKNQEQIGLVFEALGRVLAYEEQRAHQMVLMREELAEMHALMAQTNLALAADQLEKIALEAARQMFRDVYAAVQDAARKRGGEVRWSPDDPAWMEDVAKAFELGKQLGNE